MPKLPTRDDLGPAPSGRSGRVTARVDQSAIGRGIADLGRGIYSLGDIGDDIQAEKDKQAAFKAEADWQRFQWEQKLSLDDAISNMQPGQVDGFADSWIPPVGEAAAQQTPFVVRSKAFLGGVPDELKQKYDQKLFMLNQSLYGDALKFQRGEQKRADLVQIEDLSGTVWAERARTADPTELARLSSEAAGLIRSSRLSPIDQDIENRKVQAEIAANNLIGIEDPVERLAKIKEIRAAREKAGDATSLTADTFVTAMKRGIYSVETPGRSQPYTATGPWIIRKGGRKDRAYGKYQVMGDNIRSWTKMATGEVLTRQEFLDNPQAQEAVFEDQMRRLYNRYGNVEDAASVWFTGDTYEKAVARGANDGHLTVQEYVARAKTAAQGEAGAASAYSYIQADALDKLESATRKDLGKELQDYIEWLRDGGKTDPRYTSDVIKENSTLNEEITAAARQGEKMNQIALATPEETAQIVQDVAEGLNNPEHYKRNRADAVALGKALEAKHKALATDPAKYIMERLPHVSEAYEAFVTAMESGQDVSSAAQAYATAVEEAQLGLGLRVDQVKLLPAGLADSIVSNFMEQNKGGQSAARLMQAMADQWGHYWPTVYAQLAADKLPAVAAVIGSMNRLDQAVAAERLSEAAAIGTKELEKAFATTDLRDLETVVRDQGLLFRRTLTNQPGGVETAGIFQDSVYLLALGYMTDGDSPERAGERAYDDIIGKHYNIEDTYRIPVEHPAAAVRRGAQAIQTVIGDGGYELDLPQSLIGLEPKDTKAAYIDALRKNGFWVTAPDETGLVLYEGSTRSLVTVDGGQPFFMPWNTLVAAATAPRRSAVEEGKRKILGPSFEMGTGVESLRRLQNQQ